MVLFLFLLSGLAWAIVYVQCIRVGRRDRTYAMPLAALALNLAWESTYAAHGLAGNADVQTVIDIVWALLDLVIVVTFFRFGRGEFPALSGSLFAGFGLLTFAAAYAVQWLFIGEFGWSDAARYTAFLQNLLMSVLFVAMFAARRGTRGQSLTIAVAKWIGTLAPTITFGGYFHSPFILGIGILCGVFDLLYIGLLWHARATGGGPTADAVARGVGAGRQDVAA
jgi:hypothetical protein